MSLIILLRRCIQTQHSFLNSRCRQQPLSLSAFLPQKSKAEAGHDVQLSKSSDRTGISTNVKPLGKKIKENTETASYSAIILVGVGATAIMFYAIFQELFSTSSPNNIYSEALERVTQDPRVQDSLGVPIKGYGEETLRGRRQHVAHKSFDRNGVQHTRMKFYLKGIRNKATVHLESRVKPSGQIEYRYLLVQLDNYPYTTIILEDNRASEPVASDSSSVGSSLSFASLDGKH